MFRFNLGIIAILVSFDSLASWKSLTKTDSFSLFENQSQQQYFSRYTRRVTTTISTKFFSMSYIEKSIKQQFSQIILSKIEHVEIQSIKKIMVKGILHIQIDGSLVHNNKTFYFKDLRVIDSESLVQSLLWSHSKIQPRSPAAFSQWAHNIEKASK